ncbi:hypothetical protein [Isoptericola sp. NPDC055881]
MTVPVPRGARRLLLAGVLGVLALGVTAACASGTPGGGATSGSPSAPSSGTGEEPAAPEPGEHVRGLPEGVQGTMDSPAGAAWSPTPGVLLVVTYGSSSCPLVAEPEGRWDSSGGTVVVPFEDRSDGPCTMDYTPTTSAVALPAAADSGEPVSVRLGDQGTVDVAPRAADGRTGPVSWVARNG